MAIGWTYGLALLRGVHDKAVIAGTDAVGGAQALGRTFFEAF